MESWSREHTLRGALSPPRAAALWTCTAILPGAARSPAVSSHAGAPFGSSFAAAELTWGAAAAGFLAVAVYVDAVLQTLPDLLIASAAAVASFSAASRGIDDLPVAAVTGAFSFLAAFALASVTSPGRGDVKPAGTPGLWIGQPQPLILGLTIGVACVGIVVCALFVIGKTDRRTTVALGLWLVVGTSVAWAGSGQRRIK